MGLSAKPPTYYNRLHDDTSTTQPVLGTAGSITGTVLYAPAEFGNGVYSTHESNHIVVPQLPNGDKGSVEFWVKFRESSTLLPAGISRTFIFCGDQLVTGYPFIFIYYRKVLGTARIIFGLFDGTNYILNFNYVTTWNLGDTFHIALCWDKDGIDGSAKTAIAYIDGSEVSSSVASFSGVVFGGNTYICVYRSSIPDFRGYSYSIIDNLKIHDYAKTDFSGRDEERDGLNDQVILI